MGRGHLDVVAEHVVVADLERADPGGVLQLGLEAGDVAAGLVAQVAQLISSGCQPARIRPPSRARNGGLSTSASSSRRTRSASSAMALALGASGEAEPLSCCLMRAARARPSRIASQIARPAAAERQARERALQVRAPLQLGAQIGAQRRRPAGPPRHRGACGSARPRRAAPRGGSQAGGRRRRSRCGPPRRAGCPRARRRSS